MVTTAFTIDLGSASHFTTANQQDLVFQASGFDVFYKGTDRMVEGSANIVHTFSHGGIIFVGMHVPDKVGGNSDEACTTFGKSASHEKEFSQGVYMIPVAKMIVPSATDLADIHEFGSVIAFYGTWVFMGDVEGVSDASGQGFKGLVLEAFKALGRACVIHVFPPLIDSRKEVATVAESGWIDVDLHVFLESSVATGGKGFVGMSEGAGGVEFAEAHDGGHGFGLNGTGVQCDVAGHACFWVAGSGNSGVVGTEVSVGGVAVVDERF